MATPRAERLLGGQCAVLVVEGPGTRGLSLRGQGLLDTTRCGLQACGVCLALIRSPFPFNSCGTFAPIVAASLLPGVVVMKSLYLHKVIVHVIKKKKLY